MTTGLLFSIALFIVAYFFIATEKINRTAAAILGACAAIMLGLIPHEKALHLVDLNVVFLLVGMMVVVNVLAATGLFEWVAVYIAQKARGNGAMILLGLCLATALLSAFLDNVTTVVLIAPITILITQILQVPTIPFLVIETLFSNIGGTATLVGDPPNILIGSKGELTFVEFLVHLGPFVLLLVLLFAAAFVLILGKSLRTAPAQRALIMRAQPALAITEPAKLKRGLGVFALILAGFCLSHMVHVEPAIIALAGGFLMLAVTQENLRKAMEMVEWETIFFLIGLFILVGALEHNGLFKHMGHGLFALTGDSTALAAIAILWTGAALSALFGNIPVVIALIPLVQDMIDSFTSQLDLAGNPRQIEAAISHPLWWALALGCCLGGNGTLFGAAANIVVAQLARKNGYPVGFTGFLRYGLPVTVVSLAAASIYLYLRYFMLLH